jgi:hypothetical protein
VHIFRYLTAFIRKKEHLPSAFRAFHDVHESFDHEIYTLGWGARALSRRLCDACETGAGTGTGIGLPIVIVARSTYSVETIVSWKK